MPSRRILCSLLCLLAALAVAPLAAQPPILPGVDIFQTPTAPPTTSNVTFPSGFFCAHPVFTANIVWQGVPLTTLPAGIAGNADTIIQRLAQGNFVAGVANIPVIVRALRLTSAANLTVTCGTTTTQWRADACLCGAQTSTTVQASGVSTTCGGCGRLNGPLSVRVCLRFTNVATGAVRGPITQTISLGINNMPWCPNPGRNGRTIVGNFAVDTNCDNQPDLTLPGTSNFHPGWTCGDLGVNCWELHADKTKCHPNPADPTSHEHCTNPVCGQTAGPSSN